MFVIPKTMLTFDESLGSRAVLAKAATNGKFDFDAYEERILTLLSLAYKSAVPDFVLTGVKGAMNLWNTGHKAAGGIRLARTSFCAMRFSMQLRIVESCLLKLAVRSKACQVRFR